MDALSLGAAWRSAGPPPARWIARVDGQRRSNDWRTTAATVVKIFDQVRGMIPINFDTEIRVEYGDQNFFPSIYHVRSVTGDGNVMRVLLEPPATTCKARDRRAANRQTAGSCCAAKTQSCCVA